jgi:hypothetical protein
VSGAAYGWADAYLSDDPKMIFVGVAESGYERSSSCWIRYETYALWTGRGFDVRAIGMPRALSSRMPPTRGCADPGVEAYAIVNLPRPYDGELVKNVDSGKSYRATQVIHPSNKELVN